MQEASQTNFVPFTEEMRQTHTILVPGMLPLHFSLLKAALSSVCSIVKFFQNTCRLKVETCPK